MHATAMVHTRHRGGIDTSLRWMIRITAVARISDTRHQGKLIIKIFKFHGAPVKPLFISISRMAYLTQNVESHAETLRTQSLRVAIAIGSSGVIVLPVLVDFVECLRPGGTYER